MAGVLCSNQADKDKKDLRDGLRLGVDAVALSFVQTARDITDAKALIRAYYGQDAAFSYFNGCSDGGREALMEAMRFPGDFDGVIAGQTWHWVDPVAGAAKAASASSRLTRGA